jgi:hypothetical protein
MGKSKKKSCTRWLYNGHRPASRELSNTASPQSLGDTKLGLGRATGEDDLGSGVE